VKRVLYCLAAAGVLAVTAGCQNTAQQEVAENSATDPVLHPVTAEGVLAAVAEPGARAVLVNVWATWCVPCREEFPDIMQVRRELGDRGFRLILVSGDFDNQLPAAKAFLADQGVDFPTFIKDEDDMNFINALSPDWSGALPATFLYDGDGRLQEFWEGKASYETLTEKISAVLNDATNSNSEERG
jgi:thiol-disulfide isomerase/thioredoxin